METKEEKEILNVQNKEILKTIPRELQEQQQLTNKMFEEKKSKSVMVRSSILKEKDVSKKKGGGMDGELICFLIVLLIGLIIFLVAGPEALMQFARLF